jgi:hypothetical protein
MADSVSVIVLHPAAAVVVVVVVEYHNISTRCKE